MSNAKQKGVKFGRPRAKFQKNFIRTYELYKQGLIKVNDVILICNIARSTFYKYAKFIKNIHFMDCILYNLYI